MNTSPQPMQALLRDPFPRPQYLKVELKLYYNQIGEVRLDLTRIDVYDREPPVEIDGQSVAAWVPSEELASGVWIGSVKGHDVLKLDADRVWSIRSMSCDPGAQALAILRGTIDIQPDKQLRGLIPMIHLLSPERPGASVDTDVTIPADAQVRLGYRPPEGEDIPADLQLNLTLAGPLAKLLK